MKSGYTDTRANGQPVADGFLCWKIEFEPGDPNYGEHPIFVNGRSHEEISQKLSLQNMHAQAALATRPKPTSKPGTQPTAPATRKPMNNEDKMRATIDLENPEKAGTAALTLVEEEAGLNFKDMAREQFKRIAIEWEDEHPEFYRHKGNQTMVGDLAGQMVGRKLGLITKEILTTAFNQLRSQGILFEEPQPLPSPSLPAETQVQRTERPKHFATSVPGTRFRSPQTALPRGPKYTEAELNKMPESKRLELLQDKGQAGKDYEDACEYHFGSRATA